MLRENSEIDSLPHMKLQAFAILLLLGHCLGSVVKRHEDAKSEDITTVDNGRESGMLKVNFRSSDQIQFYFAKQS